MMIPRGMKKLIDFGIDFLFILAPFLEPTWTHVGHLFRPKTAQEASKMPQDAQPERDVRPFCPQDGPKIPQESSKIVF